MVARHLMVDFGSVHNANVSVYDAARFSVFSVDAYNRSERLREAEKNWELDLSRVITLWIGPFRAENQVASKQAMLAVDAELKQWYGPAEIKRVFAFRTITFRTGLSEEDTDEGVFDVVSLMYPNYRLARTAYKQLLPIAAKNRKVHCFAGENWPRRKKEPVRLPDGQTLGSDVEEDVLNQRYWSA